MRLMSGAVALALLAGFIQDRSAGSLPVALALKFELAPYPWYVASKPAHLTITVVDRFGRPSPVSGETVVLETSDPRSRLNNREVPLVNGTVAVYVQWFTSGEHTIRAAARISGLNGRLDRIKVRELPKDVKIEVEPAPWPKYVWAGGLFQAKVKVTAGNSSRPLQYVAVSARASRGVRRSPHRYYTDEAGVTTGIVFPPDFVCGGHEGGGGTVNGDAPLDVDFFVDANGNGAFDDGEPGADLPPIDVVEGCPQQLLPAALAMLRVLEEGGSLEPPPGEDDIIVSNGTSTTLSPAQLAKVKAARQYLQEQVIDHVNSGKWRGRFSDVRRRVLTTSTLLKDVAAAQPVVQRLDCAAELLEGNPDVKGLELNIQERQNHRPTVFVGFTDLLLVRNLGVRNQGLPASSFTGCFPPSISDVSVTGSANAHASDTEALGIDFECTGPGNVNLGVSVQYEAKRAIVIDDRRTGIEAVAAASVAGVAETLATAFLLKANFGLVQDGCLVNLYLSPRENAREPSTEGTLCSRTARWRGKE
jgi:hypothetical protein